MTMTDTPQTATSSDQSPPVPSPPAEKAKADPRYLALRNFAISISIFNILGYAVLGFEQPWLWPIIAVLSAYAIEISMEMVSAWAQRRAPRFMGNGGRGLYEFLLPSHITALAVNMLLYANNQIVPVIFGVFVGVAGKHALQAPIAGRMRHFMNPSNFGITVSLVCFGSWISIAPPYEFTENVNTEFRILIPFVILTSGTVINAVLTKRIGLIVGWLGGFVIQALIRAWIWDVSLYSALSVMTGVAFVLFTNYMITDPGTTPSKFMNQFMFGSGVAMIYGVLMLFNVVYTLFFATTLACLLRGLYWWGAYLVERYRSQAAVVETPATPTPGRSPEAVTA
jgi:hypothetical protein